MPSPMIYQDLTTTALLSHAAQYHSETEIVSVGAGGEKERSSWGSGQPRSAAGIGAGVAGAAAGCPLRHPRMEQSPPPGDLFCRRLRRPG